MKIYLVIKSETGSFPGKKKRVVTGNHVTLNKSD